MRLVPKLAMALLAGVFLVVAIFTAWRVRGELAEFDRDIRRDHRVIGLTAAAAVSQVPTRRDAVRLVESIDASREAMHIRFVSLSEPAGSALAPVVGIPPEQRPRPGTWLQQEQRLDSETPSGDYLVTYVAAPVADDADGAIELSQALASRRGYISRGVTNVLASSAAMLVVCGLIVSWIGARLVGKPVSDLIDTARRIGAGDFSSTVVVQRKDELGELARALSSMSMELEAARCKMTEETEARIRALEQLRHAERLVTLGHLASVLAHEIGTPLNVVAGHAKLIATGKLSGDAARESGSTIGSQCERMTQIVRGILDYARRKAPRRLWIPATDLARQVYDLLRGLAEQRRVSLLVEQQDSEAKLFADPGQLQQALINVVLNAIQASRSGSQVRLGVSTEQRSAERGASKDYVVLSVSDQGPGISPDSREQIFEPFFTTKANGEGTGLGLSVARDIVREHGGFVEVASAPDKGSTFRFYLPQRAEA
ncbi:MAG TPA: HAMP domain-containing sensor histidine kinase [Polyangiaceae bacterium]|nr:HAMP domain-containing sensor histidine kinase [Polyangiaceae bacterium]